MKDTVTDRPAQTRATTAVAGFEQEDYPYDQKLDRASYEAEKAALQVELLKVQHWLTETAQKVVMLFEGRDAAGKGGTIKRFMEHLNPRAARVVALEKPTDQERGQWFFQRYVEHLPTAGEMVLFDRSWYNRAGVERVMGFCSPAEYLEFMRYHGIDASGSGGMFFVTHSIRGLATWAQGHSRSQTLRTLQHEGFHQFAWNHLGPNLPTWMNEGLAKYFEDGVSLEHGMELGLGDPDRIARVREALRYKYTVKMDELLSLSNQQWSATLQRNGSRSELLYAQSWSMVYYLIHGDDGRYLRSFEVYLRLLSEGHAHDKAVRSAFGVGALDGIEPRWRRLAVEQQPDPVTVPVERREVRGQA